jgi:hypothetical protein
MPLGYFGKFYLDKEKDMMVRLDMEDTTLRYTILASNHRTDNLIKNFARISGTEVTEEKGAAVITGTVPCYIRGDGQRVYILRLNGTKLANIYPDGRIYVNSVVPAIAKTLMSQTRDYSFSFRKTLVKSFVPEHIKLTTDLHTHGNANLSGDILIALAIKHQIRYPLYYIKKLRLTLSPAQQEQRQNGSPVHGKQMKMGAERTPPHGRCQKVDADGGQVGKQQYGTQVSKQAV